MRAHSIIASRGFALHEPETPHALRPGVVPYGDFLNHRQPHWHSGPPAQIKVRHSLMIRGRGGGDDSRLLALDLLRWNTVIWGAMGGGRGRHAADRLHRGLLARAAGPASASAINQSIEGIT